MPRAQMADTRTSISQSKSRRERWAGILGSDGSSGRGHRRGRLEQAGRNVRDLRLRLAQASLFVEIRLDYIAYDGSGQLAVLPIFKQSGHHDLGIVARREADEPGVVLMGLAVRSPLEQVVGG